MNSDGLVKTEVDSSAAEPKSKGKRGRKKKTAEMDGGIKAEHGTIKQELITDHLPVVKKKRKIDRFNGMPEEEVLLKTLPDRLAPNLDILIVGINPGLFAAYIGHHYAGPGNHFWKCLYLSGLVPEPMNCYDDIKLQQFGIGFTNVCARTSRGSADLKRTEIEEGGRILIEKLKEYKPKIAVFNGKGIYEIFSGNKKFIFGKQPRLIEGTNTIAYVMPSSSARCSQLPRAIDKVPFYEALRRLRDYVVGSIPHLDEADVTFPTLELKTAVKKENSALKDGDRETDNLGASDSGSQNSGGGGEERVTSQPGSGPLPTIKKEGTTYSRGKGRGTKRGHQQGLRNEDELTMEETSHRPDQVVTRGGDQATEESQRVEDQFIMTEARQSHQSNPQVSMTLEFLQHDSINPLQQAQGLIAGTNGFSVSPFSTVDFTSLRPAGLTSSHLFPPSLPALDSFPSSVSQDFMSGFYPGSHQFGMVGFPNVVASHQTDGPSAGDLSGDQAKKPPLRIKSEPVDMDP